MKKICILMGSPKINGNTALFTSHFEKRLKEKGAHLQHFDLAKMRIESCKGCYACQDVLGQYGCKISDDMEKIVTSICECDAFVLATPIYTWYCTAEMKAVLDRFFGMNKYYRTAAGRLWENKKCALVLTYGYEESAAQPFIEGITNLCTHSQLEFLGWCGERDIDDLASFNTPEAIEKAEKFADDILN